MRLLPILALTLASIFARADTPPSNGLCLESETNFFSCQTQSKKWISLCGSLPGTLQYRFGNQNKVELRYPAETAGSSDKFGFARYFRYQTERVEITFTNLEVDYTIFDYTEEGAKHAGVRITMPDGKEREVACSTQITSRIAELKEALHCDADNALNGGNCP